MAEDQKALPLMEQRVMEELPGLLLLRLVAQPAVELLAHRQT